MADLFNALASPERKDLRPHQTKAIQMVRSSLGKGNKRVVCQMATGAGKTLTAAKIVEGALAKGNRVIFTVPMTILIDQTVRAFEAEGIDGVGVMQAQHPRTNPYAPVQVASVQTLARRDVPPSALVIQDECHIRAAVVEQMMQDRPDVVFLGLSATPWSKGMGLIWQDLCVAATTQELIDAGYLCPFRVFAAAHPDLTGIKTVAGDYHEGQLSERMSDGALVGDVVTTWLEHGEDRPTLCFAVNRAHAAVIHEAFLRAGIGSAYVDMNTDRVERSLIERRFRAGEVKVICSVRTMTTGVDMPVACIIDAAPTRSEMLHLQKIGRGLRVNPPWPDCKILDHSDNTLRLGFVTDIHYTRLNGDPRAEGEPAERKEPLPVECSKCGGVIPPKVNPCPHCDHERKPAAGVDVLDGELVELRGKPKVPTMEEKDRFWRMALWVDGERHKGGKLAKALYKGKFGTWPRGLSHLPMEPDRAFRSYEQSRRIAYAKRMESQRGAAA